MGILLGPASTIAGRHWRRGALINYASGFALLPNPVAGRSGDARETKELAKAVMALLRVAPGRSDIHMKAVARVHITETEQFEYGLSDCWTARRRSRRDR
jgi:hypothetical protein